MRHDSATVERAAANRRCARPRAPVAAGELRPADAIAAFFSAGIGFLVAAGAAGVLQAAFGIGPGRWLTLHLAFVGGVSQLVLGAAQFFVGAFLATGPPPRALVGGQLACWNAGTVLIAVGVSQRIEPAAVLGTALLLAALALFATALRALERRSLQSAPWAARWYLACAGFLALGMVGGALLAVGPPTAVGDLLSAHIVLNVAGWFGTAIVGTLHTFYPSLTQTRLAHPRLQPATFAAWTGGVAAVALGALLQSAAVAVAGWASVAVAVALLGANLLGSTRAAPQRLRVPARLIAAGQALLAAGVAVALASAVADGRALPWGAERDALALLLLAGWLGLTVAGSLAHLIAVLTRIRGGWPLPRI